MIKLLFVDDQSIILRFLENCFRDNERYEIVGSLTEASLVDIWCEKRRPHVIFMDIQTKEDDINGLIVAERIKEKYSHIKIIMMTGYDEISYVPRARGIGVDGFLFKSNPETYFIEALNKVYYKGMKIFPEEKKIIPVENGELPLTEREIEVLRLICRDFSNKEIAEKLFISESTVKRHIESLFRKTGKSGRVGLVAYAMSGGWINPNI